MCLWDKVKQVIKKYVPEEWAVDITLWNSGAYWMIVHYYSVGSCLRLKRLSRTLILLSLAARPRYHNLSLEILCTM